MDEFVKLVQIAESCPKELKSVTKELTKNLRRVLLGESVPDLDVDDLPIASPQQTKKRAKRLSSLEEEDVIEAVATITISDSSNREAINGHEFENTASAVPIPAPRTGLKNTGVTESAKKVSESSQLMPPPSAPVRQKSDVFQLVATESSYSGRPKRSARMKSGKSLKEPKLNCKLRRPSNFGVDITIKKEPEQRNSRTFINNTPVSIESMSANNNDNDDNVVTIATTESTTYTDIPEELDQNPRQLRIKIKREKISSEHQKSHDVNSKVDEGNKNAPNLSETIEEQSKIQSVSVPVTECDTITTSMAQLVLSNNDNVSTVMEHKKGAITKKKGRTSKKKTAVQPIKVERFSDLEEQSSVAPSPVASRTRKGNVVQKQKNSVTTSVKEITSKENKGSFGKNCEMENEIENVKDKIQSGSIYEDAIESTTTNIEGNKNICHSTTNATFNIIESDNRINDATFCTNNNPQQTQQRKQQNAETEQYLCGTSIVDENINATHTVEKHLFDATFDVSTVGQKKNDGYGEGSFETAKDSPSQTNSNNNSNNPIIGDENIHYKVSAAPSLKGSISSAAVATVTTKPIPIKTMSTHNSHNTGSSTKTKELFNPLVESPVKMRVKAFENAASAPYLNAPICKNVKKQNNSNSNTTPTIGKLQLSNLGRFLTPTQSTNIPLASTAASKKFAHSASKAASLHKSVAASNLKHNAASGSGKAVHRENSADDIRKALDTQAEERKKQREQRSKMVAQAREAKERERIARLEKAKQDREEKRIQKGLEEEKKRQLEQINRKLQEQEAAELGQNRRHSEEIRKVREQEKMAATGAILKQSQQQQQQHQQQQQQQQQHYNKNAMPPPLSKEVQNGYTFEMLHECDSTDDEDKLSQKRPPPPTWSLSNVRGPAILMQEHIASAIIDSFFSVEPITPNLKEIFPNISERHLKRNSSAIWNTPPRYSELPKY